MQRRLIQARIVNPLLGTEAIPLPDYATGGSAAMDLRACLETPLRLLPGQRLAVPTGLALNMMDP
ncbi:MAG: dUTP diphosphatase, partial [Castellaniella sp.]